MVMTRPIYGHFSGMLAAFQYIFDGNQRVGDFCFLGFRAAVAEKMADAAAELKPNNSVPQRTLLTWRALRETESTCYTILAKPLSLELAPHLPEAPRPGRLFPGF